MILNNNSEIFFTSAVISYGQDTKQLSDEIVRKQINSVNETKRNKTLVFIDIRQPKSSNHVLILRAVQKSHRIPCLIFFNSVWFLRGKKYVLLSLRKN